MTDRRFAPRLAALLAAVAAVPLSSPARAADAVWRGPTVQADPDGAGRVGTVDVYAPWRLNLNWSPASFPDSGQTATFDAASPGVAYLDGSVTVGRINLYNPAGTQIVDVPRAADPRLQNPSDVVPASGATLTLSGPAVVDVPNFGPAGTFSPTTNALAVPIAGAAGLTKTGGGLLFLTAANSYAGGTSVLGGRLVTAGPANASPAAGDARLGAAGTPVLLDNGADLFVGLPTATARTVIVNPGGGNLGIGSGVPFTATGPITGGGPLTVFGGARTFAGQSSLTGPLTLRGATTLTGTFAGVPTVRASNSLTLGSTADAANPDRLGDAATLVSEGIDLTLVRSAAPGFFAETVGTLTLDGGLTTVRMRNATGAAQSRLDVPNLDRRNGAGLAFVADGLGATVGGRNVYVGNGPALLRGAGTAIIPWALANPAAPEFVGGLQNAADTFVTYTATGITPVPASAYAADVAGANAATLVRKTAGETLPAGNYAVNGLILTAPTAGGASVALSGPGATIRVTSGAVLSADGGATDGGNVIAANLDFGPAEAVFQTPGALTLAGDIRGTGGLTKIGNNRLSLGAAPKTYTGKTTLQGQVAVEGSVIGGTAGPLGADSSAIDLRGSTADAAGGSGLAVLTVRYGGRAGDPAGAAGAGGATVDRQLLVRGTGAQVNNAGTPATDGRPSTGLTLAGGVDVADGAVLFLTRPADQTGGTSFSAGALALPTVIAAPITGAGSVGFGDSQNLGFTAPSTYAGGTTLNTGALSTPGAFVPILQIATASPFGTGPLTTNAPAELRAVGAGRTVPNDLSIAPLATAPGVAPPPSLIVGGSQDLTFTGRLQTRGGAFLDSIRVNNTALTTLAGPISGPGLFKTGPGTLILSGENAFTDRLSVGDVGAANTGLVIARSGGALGRTTTVQVLPNNALWLQNLGTAPLSAGGAGQQLLLFGRGVNGGGALVNAAGNNRFNGDTFLTYGNGSNSGPVAINVAAGTTLSAASIFSNGTAGPGLEKLGTGTLVPDGFVLNGLAVTAGTVRAAADPVLNRPAMQRGSVLGSLPTFAGGATPSTQLDLQNTTLLLAVGGTSTPSGVLNGLRGLLRSGYVGPNGAWTGGGLTTGLGTADRFALGYATGAQVPLTDRDADGTAADFAGLLGVRPNDVLVSYTLFGDSNLDGVVNLTDFQRFLAGFGKTAGAAVWNTGDFNYDGKTDGADFALLLNNFGGRFGQSNSAGASAADKALVAAFGRSIGVAAPVPEPAAAGVIGLAGAVAMLKRRRKRGL